MANYIILMRTNAEGPLLPSKLDDCFNLCSKLFKYPDQIMLLRIFRRKIEELTKIPFARRFQNKLGFDMSTVLFNILLMRHSFKAYDSNLFCLTCLPVCKRLFIRHRLNRKV